MRFFRTTGRTTARFPNARAFMQTLQLSRTAGDNWRRFWKGGFSFVFIRIWRSIRLTISKLKLTSRRSPDAALWSGQTGSSHPKPADPDYSLDNRIVEILSAKLSTQSRFLDRKTKAELDLWNPDWRNATPGDPRCFLTDYTEGHLTLHPKSNADATLYLTVYRLPLVQFTADNLDTEPEITLPPSLPPGRWDPGPGLQQGRFRDPGPGEGGKARKPG